MTGHDDAPNQSCKCGIYARKPGEWDMSWSSGDLQSGRMALGEVDLWGRVLEGERGYRAEHARIVCFYALWVGEPPGALGRYDVPIVQPPEWVADAMGEPDRAAFVVTVQIKADTWTFKQAMDNLMATAKRMGMTDHDRAPAKPRDRLPKGSVQPKPYYREGGDHGHR